MGALIAISWPRAARGRARRSGRKQPQMRVGQHVRVARCAHAVLCACRHLRDPGCAHIHAEEDQVWQRDRAAPVRRCACSFAVPCAAPRRAVLCYTVVCCGSHVHACRCGCALDADLTACFNWTAGRCLANTRSEGTGPPSLGRGVCVSACTCV